MSQLYLGLMSGTSMDGIDVALVDFFQIHPHLIACETFPYPPTLVAQLQQLCQPGDNEIERMGQADREVAEVFARASLRLLKDNFIRSDQVVAIGSHGQTIRHMPTGNHAFSLQIGDPNTLAALTGIDVVADFRRKDIALGGQGAPLVPAFHKAVFGHAEQNRIVVNIGGIANLTYLPAQGAVLGYDTGPGNTLMDYWCQKHTGQSFDAKGQWAAQSRFDKGLLAQLCQHPFFTQCAPKSTGREVFHGQWLMQQISELDTTLEPSVVQATLCQLTCKTIAKEVLKFSNVNQIFVCGGGARNEFLMECLESELHEIDVLTTDELGVHPDAVEAMAFAWLAYAHKQGIAGSLASVTGARRDAILGTFCPSK